MKKLIKIAVMWFLVATLFLVSAAITASYPPQESTAQNTPRSDTSMTIEQQKSLLQTAEQNNQVAKAMELVKHEKQVIVKERERKVYVPVPVRRPLAASENSAPEPAKRPAVTVIYEVPKYPGTQDRDKMTFAEWKMQRGLLQGKSYRLYQKYLETKNK